MRRRQKLVCRPIAGDGLSLNDIGRGSIRKSKNRPSIIAYGNVAFDDPDLKTHILTLDALVKFVTTDPKVHTEFMGLPDIKAPIDDVPVGCEDKNR